MTTTYSNDFLGRVSREVVNSGVASPSPQQEITNFTFDGLNREILVQIQNVTPGVATPSPTQQPTSCTQYIYARGRPTAAPSIATICSPRSTIPTARRKWTLTMPWAN